MPIAIGCLSFWQPATLLEGLVHGGLKQGAKPRGLRLDLGRIGDLGLEGDAEQVAGIARITNRG
jgi:hypothetical protein